MILLSGRPGTVGSEVVKRSLHKAVHRQLSPLPHRNRACTFSLVVVYPIEAGYLLFLILKNNHTVEMQRLIAH